MGEHEHAIERLEFYSRRTARNLEALKKFRRWPWKRGERLRYLSICAGRLTKIGVLNLYLDKPKEATASFDMALDHTSEFASLASRFQPSVSEIHTLSGAIVAGLEKKAISVTTVLLNSFENSRHNPGPKTSLLDSEARKHRIWGIGAFLCWILGRNEDSLRMGHKAAFESDSNALLTVSYWTNCIVAGLERRRDDFSNHIETLVEHVDRHLSSGDPSYGEECLIYTPAIVLIELARRSGLEFQIKDMQRISRSHWINKD